VVPTGLTDFGFPFFLFFAPFPLRDWLTAAALVPAAVAASWAGAERQQDGEVIRDLVEDVRLATHVTKDRHQNQRDNACVLSGYEGTT
jgi:hypothetical protein